jgi:hypothetical protein
MKKIILLTAAIFFTSIGSLLAQNYPINPIPSYNFQLSEKQAVFGEIKQPNKIVTPGREKRDMDVIISTTNHCPIPVYAKVWVVKKQGNVVLGPFTVFNNQHLSVGIDNGKWGVIVKCNWEVYVDVWIDRF